MSRLLGDLKWGVGWGVFTGVVLMTFAAGVLTLRGGIGSSGARHITWSTLLALYPVGGALGGVVVGISRRRVQSRLSAMIVGPFVVLPFLTVVIWMVGGHPRSWGGPEIFAILGASAYLGALGGHHAWKVSGVGIYSPNRPEPQRKPKERRGG